MENNGNVSAAITGAAAALTYWWAQGENEQQDLNRDLKDEIKRVDRETQIFYSGGDYYRLQAPIARDLSIGYAVANPSSRAKSNVPQIMAPQLRPDLSSGSNVQGLTYPPSVGVYDERGRTAEPGQMAIAGWVQTYQEPRAFNQGLIRSTAPTPAEQLNLFYSAQGLSHQSMKMNLSQAQWQALWSQILGSGSAISQSGDHDNPLKHPIASGGNPNIQVHALTQGVLIGVACPFVNANTDSAHHWRFVSTSALAADDLVMTVQFFAPYRYAKSDGTTVPFMPVINVHRGSHFYIKNITALGYQIYAAVAVAANTVVDLSVSVHPGTATV